MKLVKESFWFKTKVREINGHYAIKIPKNLVELNSLKNGDMLQQFLVKCNNRFGLIIVLDKKGLSKKAVAS